MTKAVVIFDFGGVLAEKIFVDCPVHKRIHGPSPLSIATGKPEKTVSRGNSLFPERLTASDFSPVRTFLKMLPGISSGSRIPVFSHTFPQDCTNERFSYFFSHLSCLVPKRVSRCPSNLRLHAPCAVAIGGHRFFCVFHRSFGLSQALSFTCSRPFHR